MSAQPPPSKQSTNPLLLPLLGITLVAICEGIAILFLLLGNANRGTSPAPPPATVIAQQASPVTGTPAPQATASPGIPLGGITLGTPTAGGSQIVRGRVGERVESAGFAITVIKVSNVAQYQNILDLDPDEKYVDVEIIIENTTGRSINYWGSLFKLKDSNDFQYDRGLAYTTPEVGFGTMVQGEKLRGHCNFIVPKSATGLQLVYATTEIPNYRTIYIDLGQ